MGLSVNVYVYNKLGNTDLVLLGSGLNHGAWIIGPYGPPGPISANGLGQWASQSDGIFTGTQGWVRYYPIRPGGSVPENPPNEDTIYIEWDAPYVGTNSYQATAPFPYVINANTNAGNAGAGSEGFYGGAASIVFDLTGASGTDTCANGYVWRDAFSGDHVCVTPAQRQQAADQNAAAAGHTDGGGQCKTGFVWRNAGPNDKVCVSPADAQAAAEQNANAKKYAL